jgi:hypothetical protein
MEYGTWEGGIRIRWRAGIALALISYWIRINPGENYSR